MENEKPRDVVDGTATSLYPLTADLQSRVNAGEQFRRKKFHFGRTIKGSRRRPTARDLPNQRPVALVQLSQMAKTQRLLVLGGVVILVLWLRFKYWFLPQWNDPKKKLRFSLSLDRNNQQLADIILGIARATDTQRSRTIQNLG